MIFSSELFSQEFQVIFDDEPPQSNSRTTEPKVNFPADTDTIRKLIVHKAHEYLGTDYIYGQSNEQGFDCSGFVRFIFGFYNYALPHSSSEQYKMSKHLKKNKAIPGDLVFFITRGRKVSHVGIYLGEKLFIHAPGKGKKVCIDSLDTAYYKKKFAGFGRIL